MKTLFITGATGFIGNHVLNKLKTMNYYRILALTRKKMDSCERVTFVEGNIQNIPMINDLVSRSDMVIHMAGCKSDATQLNPTNVMGTQNVVAACALHRRLEKMIYLSSAGVMGASRDRIVDEKTYCQPQNDYERSKYQAELIIKQYSTENPGKVVILRPTNVFGENDPDKHLLNLIRRIQKKQFCFIGKNVSSYYLNYLYVKEISECLPRLLNESTAHDLYILNTPFLLIDVIAKIKARLMSRTIHRHLPYGPVKYAVSCLELLPEKIKRRLPINSMKLREITNTKKYSSSLIKKDLNWLPAYTIEKAIDNLI